MRSPALRCDSRRGWQRRAPGLPTALPPAAPPSFVRGTGGGIQKEATSIQWTFWGKLAESCAEYLGKGSRVNIVGRVQNNNYTNADGQLVYGLTFTCEEIDYLDSRGEAEARRSRQEGGKTPTAPAVAPLSTKGTGRTRAGSKPAAASVPAKGVDPDDIPF